MESKNNKNPKQQKRSAWKILFRHLAEYKPTIILLGLLGVISALANGTVPFIVGMFLDALLNLGGTLEIGDVIISTWLAILILWILVQFIANLVDFIIDRYSGVLDISMHLRYQEKAFRFLLTLPLSFHKDEKIGKLSEFISKTSWQIASIVKSVFARLTPPILSVVVGIVVISTIHPIFVLIILSGIFLYILILRKILIPTANILEKGHSAWNDAYGDAFQSVSNITSVKNMVTEEYESKKIEKNFMSTTANLWKKVQYVWSNIDYKQRLIVMFTQAVTFAVSVYFIQRGELTIGQLVALNSYAGLLFGPFILMGHTWQTMQNGLINIRKAEETIFNIKPENYHPENAYTPEKIKGEVEFRNVSFSYDETNQVLHDLNFKVNKGERVAMVGKSGVGKSTAIDLISAYYFPTKGDVLIDGYNTKEFDLIALRSGIAIVPQEPVLFNDTIMMNIRYGKLDATDAEVIEAAKKAHAHEFIDEMPNKYNQLVGERGVKLSVGQKQRVAIARAILRDPAILILDEPTSALDAETEKHLSETFEELMEGRTTFIIAHRLSTVRKADRIFVFEKGKIVEEGKHEDLIKKENGVYKRLHDYQIGLK